jgi:hypothetical protein
MKANAKFVLLCLVLILVWGGATSATELPPRPVTFKLESPPTPFKAGESQQLVLRMVVREAALVTDIQLSGSGWAVSPVQQALVDVQGTTELYRLEFTLEAADADRPLEFSYQLDGMKQSRTIDLSDEKLRGTKYEGQAIEVDPSDVTHYTIQGNVDIPFGPEIPEAWSSLDPAEWRPSEGQAPPVRAKVGRSIRITGEWGDYTEGAWRPGWGTSVTAFAVGWPQATLLGGGTVAEDGTYDIQAQWLWDPFDPDIFLIFWASNDIVRVTPDEEWFDEDSFRWTTPTYTVTGTVLNVSPKQPAGNAPALNIMGSIFRSYAWWHNFGGYSNPPQIHAHWPSRDDRNFYRIENEWYEDREYQIYISDDSEWDEILAGHEYGHHFVAIYGNRRPPQYCNYVCDVDVSADNCSHCAECEENEFIAFSEGFPTWLADATIRDWRTRYGYDPISFSSYNFEYARECTQPGYEGFNDPWITEEFFTTLLRDIDDPRNEDDALLSFGFWDRLNMHPGNILQIVDDDGPQTTIGFIDFFEARFPAHKWDFWETCRNNGYMGLDTEPPATSFLFSNSHGVDTPSTNNNVELGWFPTQDDYSGPGGYSLTVNRTMTAIPDMVAESDIPYHAETYLVENLAPGEWMFAIRAMDREGNWDPDYRSFGPVIIVEPDPGDLRPEAESEFWDYPFIVKDTGTANTSVVHADVLALEDVSYLNGSFVNYGVSATAPMDVTIRVDGKWDDVISYGPLDPGDYRAFVNRGPKPQAGGRHTYEIHLDSAGEAAEADETDNRYAHQWVWYPDPLTHSTVHTLDPPPQVDGGHDYVTDQIPWYNCLGLELLTASGSVPSPWVLLATYAEGGDDNVDLQLYDAPTGSEAGYDPYSLLGFSLRPEGHLDAVIVNAANRSAHSYAAGVLNRHPTGHGGNFKAQIEYAHELDRGIPYDGTLGNREGIALFSVGLVAAGPYQLHLDLAAGAGSPPVYAAWYGEDFTTGALLGYDEVGVTDAEGGLLLEFEAAAGTHGLILWRDPIDAPLDEIQYTLTVKPPYADLVHYQPAGWVGPLVPAEGPVVTPTSGPEPAVLFGETQTTYLNLAVENQSPSFTSPLHAATYIDGERVQEHYLGFMNGWEQMVVVADTPVRIHGGRHMVSMEADNRDLTPEDDEWNNSWGTQYVFSPFSMFLGDVEVRPAPPNPVWGWNHLTSFEDLYANCDGVATPEFSPGGGTGWWGAVAIMPAEFVNLDLRLFEETTGPRNGFDVPLTESNWPIGRSDFVLMNFNQTTPRRFDAGIFKWQASGDEDYHITTTESSFAGSDPNGTIGTFSLGAGQLIRLHEVEFTEPRNYRVTVEITEPTLDLGVTMYGKDEAFFGKVDVCDATCVAWTEPAGVTEKFSFGIEAQEEGFYCLAVWKVGANDVPIAGSYTLTVEEELFLTELAPVTIAGWDAPAVPRPAQDATRNWSPLPAAIPGDTATTYVNYSYTSDPDLMDPGPCEIILARDGLHIDWYNFPGAAAGGTWYHLGTTPHTFPGGRHMLGFMVDAGYHLDELDETNNRFGSQHVWTPQVLDLNVPAYREQLWPYWEGWEYAQAGVTLWPNVDGVRTPVFQPETTDGYWACMALMCDDPNDVDLGLYPPSTGFDDGFTTPLILSQWPPGQSDFVLVNFNVVDDRQFDLGIASRDDMEDENMVVVTESQYLGLDPDGSVGNFTLAQGELVDLFEFRFNTLGHYRLDLGTYDSNIDLGLSLYGASGSYYAKDDVRDDGIFGPAIAYANPAGTGESIEFIIDVPGYYAVAVWKADHLDRNDFNSYNLTFTLIAPSDVEDRPLPVVNRLASVHPNPFNPAATVAFELATPQEVRLEVFDLRGRLIRTLADEALPAGHHERMWLGADATGRSMASGVYVVRLIAGETVEMKRVSLIK